MSHVAKTLRVQKRIAMSFIGRTFARLRYIQRISKQRMDAVVLVTKETYIAIYLDGIEVLKATRASVVEWNVNITHRLNALLQSH